MKDSTKESIKFIASVVVLAAGVALTFISLFLPPAGDISASALTALGEFLTFVGAVWGIGNYTKVQIAKINRKSTEGEESE